MSIQFERNVRTITPINRKARDEKVAVFDFETLNWSEPFGCGLMDSSGYKLIEKQESESKEDYLSRVATFILAHFQDYIVYSHNGGKFDMLFLIKAFQKHTEVETKFIIAGSSIIAIILKLPNKRRIRLFDSARIFQCTLETIGTAIGLEKLEIDYTDMLKEDWRPYLFRDCEILFRAISELQSTIKKLKSTMKPTAASTAMETFRRRFLLEPIRVEIDGGEWLRPYYCGGRVEVFLVGQNGRTYVYDVNSMYPFIMDRLSFPIGLPIEITTNLEHYLSECNPITGKYAGFFRCEVDLPACINIPVLPYKTEGKLLFPVGKFLGVWSGLELLALQDCLTRYNLQPLKHIRLLHGYIYNTKPLFSEYVKVFYDLKKQGGIYSLAAKLFLNSLYGKFGEGRIKKSYIMNPDLITIEKDLRSLASQGANINPVTSIPYLEIPELNIWSLTVDRLPKHTSVPIAAHVTAGARAHLWRLMMEAQDKGARVMYCDTDSLFLDKPVFENSSQLGGLKLEGSYEESFIQAPKLYALTKPIEGKEKVRAKGFRQLTAAEFLSLLERDNKGQRKKIHIAQGVSQFKSMLTATKRAVKQNPKQVLDVWALEIDKGLQSDYTKRIVLKDNSTNPIEILLENKEDSWTDGIYKDLREILANSEA